MKKKMSFSHWIWGTFMLLAAAFVLSNQFGGFVDIGIGSVIVTVLALAFAVQCIAQLAFALLPVPLAVLYVIFQEPLGWPYLQPWTLILAAAFSCIGLFILLPRRNKYSKWDSPRKHGHYSRGGKHGPQVVTEDGGNDNNPSVSVNFGATSRYLHSDCLETVQLYCNFGALEVFFGQAQPSPNGTEVNMTCSFGAITIFVPKHWHVIDNLGCTLGGVDLDNRFAAPAENAPVLTLTGSVTMGGIEVRLV
jgi:hypothetical protein